IGLHRVSSVFARIFAAVNVAGNVFGEVVLAFVGWMPGWLSNTLIALALGVVMLLLFKLTSNQNAIGRVRDGIKADLLSLKLFKDSLPVTLGAQGRLLKGAGTLLALSLVPLLVMVPVMLPLFAQMGVWYQHDPLTVGETTLVAMQFADGATEQVGDVALQPADGFDVVAGPMRAPAAGQVWWTIRANQDGAHEMAFALGDQTVTKTLQVGAGPARVSKLRPAMTFTNVMMHPAERPFAADDVVQWIDVDYDERSSWTSGADNWLIYLFVLSLVFGFAFKGVLGVKI
ncbi:MAG: hypothetical protein ACYTFO_06330, partial [Planctomycetota bacterium]